MPNNFSKLYWLKSKHVFLLSIKIPQIEKTNIPKIYRQRNISQQPYLSASVLALLGACNGGGTNEVELPELVNQAPVITITPSAISGTPTSAQLEQILNSLDKEGTLEERLGYVNQGLRYGENFNVDVEITNYNENLPLTLQDGS